MSYLEAGVPKHRCGHIACGTYCSLRVTCATYAELPEEREAAEKIALSSGAANDDKIIPDLETPIVESSTSGGREESFFWKPPILTAAQIKAEVAKNPNFLKQRLCEELRRADRGKRGIVLAPYLSEIIRRLSARDRKSVV